LYENGQNEKSEIREFLLRYFPVPALYLCRTISARIYGMVRTRGGERAKKTGIKYFRGNGVLWVTTPVENECPAVCKVPHLPVSLAIIHDKNKDNISWLGVTFFISN